MKKGFFILITLFFAITASSQQKNSFQQEDSSHQNDFFDIQQYVKKRAHLDSKIILESLNSVYRQGCFGNYEISESQLKRHNERIILLTRIKESILRNIVKNNNRQFN